MVFFSSQRNKLKKKDILSIFLWIVFFLLCIFNLQKNKKIFNFNKNLFNISIQNITIKKKIQLIKNFFNNSLNKIREFKIIKKSSTPITQEGKQNTPRKEDKIINDLLNIENKNIIINTIVLKKENSQIILTKEKKDNVYFVRLENMNPNTEIYKTIIAICNLKQKDLYIDGKVYKYHSNEYENIIIGPLLLDHATSLFELLNKIIKK